MNEKNSDTLEDDLLDVLAEIRFLAKIKSPNVVYYNHSWIEVLLNADRDGEDDYSNLRAAKSESSDSSSYELKCVGDEDESPFKNNLDKKVPTVNPKSNTIDAKDSEKAQITLMDVTYKCLSKKHRRHTEAYYLHSNGTMQRNIG